MHAPEVRHLKMGVISALCLSLHFLVVNGLLDLNNLVHADVPLGKVFRETVVGQTPKLHDRVTVVAIRNVVLRRLGPCRCHA